MFDLKLPSSNTFKDQQEVDEYVLETEEIASNVNNEKDAINLYKCIIRLKNVEELFFIPHIVLSWEEMALSFIESPAAVFECVYYEQISEIHKKGFLAFETLETHVLNNKLPEEALFGMIHGFNLDVYHFNKLCKKYHQEDFDYYVCRDTNLRQKYYNWSGNVNVYKEAT